MSMTKNNRVTHSTSTLMVSNTICAFIAWAHPRQNGATNALSDSAWVCRLEDEEAYCAVCSDGNSIEPDQIVFCERCDLAVHQQCYGVPEIPEGRNLQARFKVELCGCGCGCVYVCVCVVVQPLIPTRLCSASAVIWMCISSAMAYLRSLELNCMHVSRLSRVVE